MIPSIRGFTNRAWDIGICHHRILHGARWIIANHKGIRWRDYIKIIGS